MAATSPASVYDLAAGSRGAGWSSPVVGQAVTLSPDVVKDFSDALTQQLNMLHMSIMENLSKHSFGVTAAWEYTHSVNSKTFRLHTPAEMSGFAVDSSVSSDANGGGGTPSASAPSASATSRLRNSGSPAKPYLKSSLLQDHDKVAKKVLKRWQEERQPTAEALQKKEARPTGHHVQDFDEIVKDGYATFVRNRAVSFADPKLDWRKNAMSRHTFTTFIMEPIICAVLVANTIVIGVSLDNSPGWPGWQVVDAAFLFIYVMEIVTKLFVLGWRDFMFGPLRWQNVFDVFITCLAIVGLAFELTENSAIGRGIIIARLVKLVRMGRIVRLFQIRLFKELTAMISGLYSGLKTLMWACILLLLAIYPISLILTNFLGQGEDTENKPLIRDAFKSVPRSTLTVFRCVIGDCTYVNGTPMVPDLVNRYGNLWIVGYVSVMMMVTFGLFNLIVAVFVDNALSNAKNHEREAKITRLKDRQMQREKTAELLEILLEHVLAGQEKQCAAEFSLEQMLQMTITREHFDEWMEDRRVRDILDYMDVPEEERLDIFDVLDADGNGTLQLDELTNGVIKLRGATRRSDIIHVLLVVRSVQEELHDIRRMIGMPPMYLEATPVTSGLIQV